MDETVDHEGVEVLGADEVAALLAALADESREVRIACFEAVTRLPLAPATWKELGGYCALVLGSSDSEVERLAVIDAVPWVPLGSTRRLVARLAEDAHGEVRARARRALVAVAESQPSEPEIAGSPLRPRWVGGEPPGFATYTAAELMDTTMVVASLDLIANSGAGVPGDTFLRLSDEAVHSVATREVAPVAVTALFAEAARAHDILLGNDVARWVERIQGGFRPHLEGLLDVYRGLALDTWNDWQRSGTDDVFPGFFDPGIEEFGRWLCWQIGWTVSRGGLRDLLAVLDSHLASGDRERRLVAACLIADAAGYVTEPTAPQFGGGVGPPPPSATGTSFDDSEVPWHTPPTFQPPTGAQSPTPGSPASPLDDDVQFTVYRPRLVRPQEWYRLLAFAHKTTPVLDVNGAAVDPVEEVKRQAETALRDEPAGFGSVAVDSTTALSRGSGLFFEPWLEQTIMEPERAWFRWEGPVHQVSFRFRVPATAEGRRLEGGLRVFLGAVLVGEARLQITVSRTAPWAIPSGDPVPVQRYQQIFASYSHNDADVVRECADYVAVTGARYFIDVQALRSGERWQPRITQLIEDADVFQLFWSHNSMRSEFVRQEWEYALGLGRPGFIRPVYWQDPMPADPERGLPPEALRRLHFAKLPRQSAPTTAPSELVMPPPRSADPRAIQASLPEAPQRVEAPQAPERPPQDGDVICRACGTSNPETRTFCRHCGSLLATGDVARPQEPLQRASPRRAPLVGLLALLALLGAIMVAVYLQSR